MDKQLLLEKFRIKIAEEAENLAKGARTAHEYATNSESKSEGKYDTRGLEASYLAGAQAKLATESLHTVSLYNTLILKDFAADEGISLTAIVELELDEKRLWYFIGPKGGGLSVEHEGRTISLITLISPLGQRLLGKKAGDYFTLRIENNIREYEIISVS